MNKKFSTLLAGTMLAASTGAFAQGVGTSGYPVGVSDAAIVTGNKVYFANSLYFPKKDSLALNFNEDHTDLVPVANVSKAQIDSLIFTVTKDVKAEMWEGTAKSISYATWANKDCKIAFNKPAAGKYVSNAILNANGVLNKWIVADVYFTATDAKYVAPFAVASWDDAAGKPKTVYVLAILKDATKTAAKGALQVVEVAYDVRLLSAANSNLTNDANKIKVTDDAAATWSTTDETHYLATFGRQIVKDGAAAVALTGNVYDDKGVIGKGKASNAEEILGYANPSFDFITDNDVNGTERNLLAAYNWELVATPTKGTAATTGSVYMRAIGAKQAGTNRDLYLTVDTAYYDKVNKTSLKLELDTLPCDGSYTYDASKMVRNKLTYEFKVSGFYGLDSVTVSATNLPKMTGDYFKKASGVIDVVTPAADQVLIIKNFAGQRVLTPIHSGDATKVTLIKPSKFPTFELIDNPIAQFITGDVYNVFDMNKKTADGKADNANYGRAIIIDNMDNRDDQVFVKAEKFNGTLPSHQWMTAKENNVYTFLNRETGAGLNAKNWDDWDETLSKYATTNLVDAQLYTVDATNHIYTYGDCKDTIKLAKVTTTLTPFDGYKHLTRAEQMNQMYNLRFVSELLGDEAFVQQGADSVMMVKIGNTTEKAEIRLLDLSVNETFGFAWTDTIKLGVEGHQLTVVPYAVKVGRYFLEYDYEKKTYRFTTKQDGEADAEKWMTYNLFAITKLVEDGSYALVPYGTLKYNNFDKLAIDSKNGSAVKVALNSDLRHEFKLTPADQGVFAQVADSALTSIKIKSVENLGWSIAKGQDDFIYEGVPSVLKAGGAEYDKTAFDFKLDTAYVNRAGNTRPLYYITYGAARHDSTFVPHNHDVPNHVCPGYAVNDTISGKYLFIMGDSIDTNRANELKYSYIYNDEHFAKLQFLNAKHVKDTLIANIGRPAPLAMDTMKAGAIDAETIPALRQNDWLAGSSNKALFAFRVNMDNKEEFAIYNPATNLYITYLNGFVVASSDAAFYTLKDDEGFNVGNEAIEGASTVSVIAKTGAVEIAGAEGKKVLISNILGQVIANTTLTSDNAAIAAPKGIVVVAVEGEEAVKAIVK